MDLTWGFSIGGFIGGLSVHPFSMQAQLVLCLLVSIANREYSITYDKWCRLFVFAVINSTYFCRKLGISSLIINYFISDIR